MLANEFGAEGFALDLSADALRQGVALMDRWGLSRAPVRIAGDALHLPFRDASLRFVMACQTLSQFMDIEAVFLEVKRVLAPGGVFLFAEEPLRRLLSLRLYRCNYQDRMKPWEKRLFEWGLLGYLVRDVIGAQQEESFGIRQNHTMYLNDWHRLVRKHFAAQQYHIVVPERGWGERVMKRLAVRLDPQRSLWRAAHLLGGALAASCKKEGLPPDLPGLVDRFESFLQCPDCRAGLARQTGALLCASCGYFAPEEGGVFNLLPSAEKTALYPGDRDDAIDFSQPEHSARLLDGWHDLEGAFGNYYRWMGARASVRLRRGQGDRCRLRLRGYAPEVAFHQAKPVRIEVSVNGVRAAAQTLDRPGLFIIETDLRDAPEYRIDIAAAPTWTIPEDGRTLTVNFSMIQMIPAD
jgi:SAM-dependent methyltransferase